MEDASATGSSPRVEPIIFHIDMDAFYASCEERRNPKLMGKPLIVGADPRSGEGRGVVTSCNYEARKFKVHSAMPISQAYRLCRKANFVRPDFQLYGEVSGRVMRIISKYADKVEQVSIDEAYVDITDKVNNGAENPLEVANRIKEDVYRKEGLTCSIGIAPGKILAKIASDNQKPNGLTVIKREQAKRFLAKLPVGKIPYVGKKTQEILSAKLKVSTVDDLANTSVDKLREIFGKHGVWMWEVANGLDESRVIEYYETKSISSESTFMEDTDSRDEIIKLLDDLANEVHERATEENYLFKTVGIKIRFEDFDTYTRAKSLSSFANSAKVISETCKQLIEEFRDETRKVRLLGVRVSNLRKQPQTEQDLTKWLS
jgi:DNA polymerase IV (DinB-like DNA polymerase)